jgi:hypothetical protein
MVSPAARHPRRHQAETPLILLSEFPQPPLKAKCAGGFALTVKVDLNGEASEIDVQQ